MLEKIGPRIRAFRLAQSKNKIMYQNRDSSTEKPKDYSFVNKKGK
jgi:hypothetical protein